MRKEVSPPVIAGIIALVVVLLIVVGYVEFRPPPATGHLSPQDVKVAKDPASDGKMGKNSEKSDALPPTDPGSAFPATGSQ